MPESKFQPPAPASLDLPLIPLSHSSWQSHRHALSTTVSSTWNTLFPHSFSPESIKARHKGTLPGGLPEFFREADCFPSCPGPSWAKSLQKLIPLFSDGRDPTPTTGLRVCLMTQPARVLGKPHQHAPYSAGND